MKPLALFLSLALLFTGPLRADHPAAPDGAAIEGSSSGTIGSALTGQQLYMAADLAGLKAGDVITGISLRLDGASPAFAGASFTRYDIHLGVGQGSLTPTFANNFAGPATVVRSGILLLFASTFPSGGSPNSFGLPIQFGTPYVYAGGNLLMEIRSSAPSTSFIIDTYNAANGAAGQEAYASNADATTATLGPLPANWAIAFEVTRAGATPERIAIPAGAAVEGNTGGSYSSATGLAGQMRYLPAQLGSLKPGDRIAGIGFRLDNAVANFLSTTFSRFDIHLGKGSAGYSTNAGTAYATNYATPPTFMRGGPMTLFLAGIAGNPNPFATRPIQFNTPYTYTGGPLLFETRSSQQTTPLFIDNFLVGGYGGGIFNYGGPDSLVGSLDDANFNWAMELHVLRDKTAPTIFFSGKPKLTGRRTRVTGGSIEAGTVATIVFSSSTGQRGTVRATAEVQPFFLVIRSRVKSRPVRVTVTATDASGNRATKRRVYRP